MKLHALCSSSFEAEGCVKRRSVIATANADYAAKSGHAIAGGDTIRTCVVRYALMIDKRKHADISENVVKILPFTRNAVSSR